MIADTKGAITLKEGVRVNLLFTPFLSGYAKKHGFTLKGDPNDVADVARVFTEIIYCAAEAYWDAMRMSKPLDVIEEFPYDYTDFVSLPLTNPKEFGDTMKKVMECYLKADFVDIIKAKKKALDEKKNDSIVFYVDYDHIEKFLIGRCGKTPLEAALTSYQEYLFLLEGKMEENRLAWMTTRWSAWWNTIISPNIKAADKPKRPEDIMLFEWEEELEKERRKEKKEIAKVSEETKETLNRLFNNSSIEK